jgi:hypothetical protein
MMATRTKWKMLGSCGWPSKGGRKTVLRHMKVRKTQAKN